ncbi:MAG TPA: glutamate-5-semialdehyde dehydrogenase [Candidatus Anoxymicrobiaceae bacterium]
MGELEELALRARAAAAGLSTLKTEVKNGALLAMGDALQSATASIIAENAKDLETGREQGLSTALMDRLALSERRVSEMAAGLRDVAALRDPVGEMVDGWRLPNGLLIEKVRVPLGVIGIIYEARPNVTVDASGLCIKSGNAVVLRGSSNAINSNTALVRVLAEAGSQNGLPENSIQLVESTDRQTARELMRMHGLIDVLIPRGGEGLIRTVVENSTVPVIETGVGNCHIYVDESADIQMAVDIVVNAKTQRPGVCNAAETMLVNESVADGFLPAAWAVLKEKGVTLRGDERTRELLGEAEVATEEDWYTEYLDLVLAVRVVPDVGSAIEHINKYGSGHSEAIITSDYSRSRRFIEEVDSAAVYVNASTRFTDGGQFGMGAEIGISTQKLHARGPMSLPELTTTKFVILGTGQVR